LTNKIYGSALLSVIVASYKQLVYWLLKDYDSTRAKNE